MAGPSYQILYLTLRQFPAALKLYDRVLDITPNDLDVMGIKASIYQAQGNLQEAAKLLSEVTEQTPSQNTFGTKINQLQLERNYGEAVRLLQTRQAQFHFDSEYSKTANQVLLALMQRLTGDAASAKLTGQQVGNTLEQLHRDQPDNARFVALLSQAYAVMGQKDSALKTAQRAIMLLPSAKDAFDGPGMDENLAVIQTIVGENSRAISILTRLSQTPYFSPLYSTPITPALLKLDPLWDPLRGDPAFQKTLRGKAAVKAKQSS